MNSIISIKGSCLATRNSPFVPPILDKGSVNNSSRDINSPRINNEKNSSRKYSFATDIIAGARDDLDQFEGRKVITTKKEMIQRSNTTEIPGTPSFEEQAIANVRVREPTGVSRSKCWSVSVENNYRFQLAGFRDQEEYLAHYPIPQLWNDNGFMRCLQSKRTGYFMYFRRHRECADKYVPKVKIYTY